MNLKDLDLAHGSLHFAARTPKTGLHEALELADDFLILPLKYWNHGSSSHILANKMHRAVAQQHLRTSRMPREESGFLLVPTVDDAWATIVGARTGERGSFN